MKQKLVSVIVPIYNADAFLDKCLYSIVNQGYRDLDIILINDGSTDQSFQICEEYRQKDPRIRVISQSNAGLSAARNHGIEVAIGDYISFVDADDWLEENFFERMVAVHEESDSDVTVCNYARFETEKSLFVFYKDFKNKYVKTYTPAEWLLSNYGSIEYVVAWGKLYNRELFKLIRYPVGKIAEDEYTTTFVYLLSQKVVYVNEPLYIYRKNPNGICGTKTLFERMPLQSIEEEFTMATLVGGFDTSSIRKIYLERLRLLKEYCLREGRVEDYRHICLKLEVLKKHGIDVE